MEKQIEGERMLDENVMKKILKALRGTEHSLTINQISKSANIHRVTAAKYLAVMHAMDRVKMRNVGKAKLFLLRGRHEK